MHMVEESDCPPYTTSLWFLIKFLLIYFTQSFLIAAFPFIIYRVWDSPLTKFEEDAVQIYVAKQPLYIRKEKPDS